MDSRTTFFRFDNQDQAESFANDAFTNFPCETDYCETRGGLFEVTVRASVETTADIQMWSSQR